MLRYSVSLQTATLSLAVSCPLLLRAALGSATRFLGDDAGCLLYKQSNLSLQSLAAEGGRCQSILDFRFWIWDLGLKNCPGGTSGEKPGFCPEEALQRVEAVKNPVSLSFNRRCRRMYADGRR
jgi:hypothetical protein